MQLGPGVGNGTATTTQTLYGQIPINQFVTPGVYSENLTLTINF